MSFSSSDVPTLPTFTPVEWAAWFCLWPRRLRPKRREGRGRGNKPYFTCLRRPLPPCFLLRSALCICCWVRRGQKRTYTQACYFSTVVRRRRGGGRETARTRTPVWLRSSGVIRSRLREKGGGEWEEAGRVSMKFMSSSPFDPLPSSSYPKKLATKGKKEEEKPLDTFLPRGTQQLKRIGGERYFHRRTGS